MNLGVERFLISEFWPWAPTWCGFKESWGGVKSSQAPAPHQINAPNPSPLTGSPSHLPSWKGTDFSTLFKIWGQTKFQIPFCFPRIVLLVLVLGGFFGPPWTTLGSNFIYKHTEKHQNSHCIWSSWNYSVFPCKFTRLSLWTLINLGFFFLILEHHFQTISPWKGCPDWINWRDPVMPQNKQEIMEKSPLIMSINEGHKNYLDLELVQEFSAEGASPFLQCL